MCHHIFRYYIYIYLFIEFNPRSFNLKKIKKQGNIVHPHSSLRGSFEFVSWCILVDSMLGLKVEMTPRLTLALAVLVNLVCFALALWPNKCSKSVCPTIGMSNFVMHGDENAFYRQYRIHQSKLLHFELKNDILLQLFFFSCCSASLHCLFTFLVSPSPRCSAPISLNSHWWGRDKTDHSKQRYLTWNCEIKP